MNKKGATRIGMFLSLLVALTAVIGLGPMVIGEVSVPNVCDPLDGVCSAEELAGSCPEPEPACSADGKVLLCHVPPGNPDNAHTIAVKLDKADKHLAHGDTLGACSTEEVLKVDICHVPPGNPDNAHTITVSDNALPAHLAHGDTEGACGAVVACPCWNADDLIGVDGCGLLGTPPNPDSLRSCAISAEMRGFTVGFEFGQFGTFCADSDKHATNVPINQAEAEACFALLEAAAP